MLNAFFWITLAAAGADWLATGKGWKMARRVTKPAALLAMLLWFTTVSQWQGRLVWFGLALVFSLIGDVSLLFPRKLFYAGLAAFLVAHLAYITGLNPTLPRLNLTSLIPFVVLLVGMVGVARPLRRALKRSPMSRRMKIPVYLYSAVLSLMLFSALYTLLRPDWPPLAAILTSLGGALFFASDSLLGTARFIGPVRREDLLVIVSYHLGQLGLISGALLRYLG